MLTIEDLHKEDIIREFEIREAYDKILQNCQEEIQYTHRNMRKYQMLFNIPRGVAEEPEYEFVGCVIYVIKSLRKNGFYVRFVRPNFVYVSWANPRKIERKISDLKSLIKEDYMTHKVFDANTKKKIVYKRICD